MNNNTRPDILGICEIENRPVVEKLVSSLASLFNHDYKIIHAGTQDEEGLICSFMMVKSLI
jgi:Endonuclease/Exonuclease/phosphatase family